MLPGSRESITTISNGEEKKKAFSDLYRCLEVIHKLNIVHRDIRSSNCLYVASSWQLIDFDLAGELNENNCCPTTLVYGSVQYNACGYSVQSIATSDNTVDVDWTRRDDIEMLHNTCSL